MMSHELKPLLPVTFSPSFHCGGVGKTSCFLFLCSLTGLFSSSSSSESELIIFFLLTLLASPSEFRSLLYSAFAALVRAT